MLRSFVLGLGAFFHLMTCLTLGLFIFPMICVSSYPAFATDGQIEWFGRKATDLRDWIANRWDRRSAVWPRLSAKRCRPWTRLGAEAFLPRRLSPRA